MLKQQDSLSPLQKRRVLFPVELPALLTNPRALTLKKGALTTALGDIEALKAIFPKTFGREQVSFVKGSHRETEARALKIGVFFSGGQAAGGHNVITGLFDALVSYHPSSQLLGFLGGPSGLVEGKSILLTREGLSPYRNQGGFDLIGSGRTKIETPEQFQASLKSAQELSLDGIVVIGGDDSNTNAALLAEFFLEKGCKTQVIGVPKTIDGDLRSPDIEISFGFDTACKTYNEMIGNICRDAISAKKYYHFIKLMGRSASHIALECAHATHPNYTLIGEEIEAKNRTLSQITKEIADLIVVRAEQKKNYGVILVPEGLIEFIPEIKLLIQELNRVLSKHSSASKEGIKKSLSPRVCTTFESLPDLIQDQLLLTRDPHGNVQVSLIETEKLLIESVAKELSRRQDGYKGKFSPLSHFFGYEGRSAMPSNFDARYCYALGASAALLLQSGLTGYLAAVTGLKQEYTHWEPKGIPLTSLMNLETRHGKSKPVIRKALVNLEGESFLSFARKRDRLAIEDHYLYPGPIQYFGDRELTDSPPRL